MSPFRLRIGRAGLLVVALAALTAVPSEARDTATLITVTTSADESNGPAGGISLREAIQTTNSAPGQYLIRFVPGLGPIDLASELPRLTGGGVSIEGDVTVRGAGHSLWGLIISSSGNTIGSLTLDGFDRGIGLLPTGSNGTYSGNVVRDVVMKNIRLEGISGFGGSHTQALNQWLDTQLVGNTISGNSGIELFDLGVHDVVERLTISGNAVHIAGIDGGVGIGVVEGSGAGGDSNRLSGLAISGNTIDGAAATGINVVSAQVGASSNTVEHVAVGGNHVQLAARSSGRAGWAIGVGTGDGGSAHNALRDVEIADNVLSGGPGISVSAGCCGAADNSVENVRLLRNTIASPCCLSVWAVGAQQGGYATRVSVANRVSGLTIDSNRITVADGPFGDQPDIGAILLLGSRGQDAGLVTHAEVTDNQIDGPVGIALVGGAGEPDELAQPEMAGNEVSDVLVGSNTVTGYRTAGIRAWGGSTCSSSSALRDNRVEALVITGNHLDTDASLTPGVDIAGAKSCGPAATLNRAEAIQVSHNTIGGNDSIRIVGGDGPGAFDNSAAGIVVGPNDRAGSLILATDLAGATGNHLGVVVAPTVAYPSPSATAISAGSATIAGIVDAFGTASTYRFQYGTSSAYGEATVPVAFSNGPQEVSSQLSGLAPGTTYHFRLVAENAAGRTEGADQTFTTLPLPPGLAYGRAAPRRTRATLRATLDARGVTAEWWVRYGRTRPYGHSTRMRVATAENSAVSVELRRLRPGARYHYVIVARNAGGTTTGPDATFRTKR
jgi:hypothetical protein